MIENLEQIKNNHIAEMIRKYPYDITDCAKRLGISYSCLVRTAQKLNLKFYARPKIVIPPTVHFKSNKNFSQTICNQNSGFVYQDIKTSTVESEVTCKRCKKKLEAK